MGENAASQDHRIYVGMSLEVQAAVGRISVWAASVEWELVELCVSLINSRDHEVGYAVTAHMSASGVIHLVKKLVADSEEFSEKEKAEMHVLLTSAKKGLEDRNRILHAKVGLLTFDGKSSFTRRRKASGAPETPSRWESTMHGADELDEIGARLFSVSEELWGWVNLPADDPDADSEPDNRS